ncbi:MAG: zinc-ribbon domain-containing protein, partial [Gammaproteobacteria bacterium]
MALATQCPHCHTTFRVAADQLKLRGGIVRCGACHEIFDGNASLIDLDAPPRPPVELPPPTPTAADDAPVYALDFGSALNRHGILPQAVEPQPEPEPEQPEEAVDFSDLLSVGPSFLRRQEPVAPLNEGAMDPGLRRDDGLEGEGEVEAVETPAVEAVVPEDSPEPESQDPSPLGRQEPITPPSGDAMDPGLRQDDGIEVAEEVEVPEPPATEVAAPEQPQEPETAEPSPLGRQEPIAPQSSGAMDPGLRQDDGLEAEGEVEAVEAP